MLPDEMFLLAISFTIRNTELNDMQMKNQERIEKKMDETLEKISKIEERLVK